MRALGFGQGRYLASALALGCVLVAAGCTGLIEPPGGASGDEGSSGAGGKGQPLTCKANELYPGAAPLRRLTNAEYDHTVRDLLGDDTAPGKEFTPDAQSQGFENYADAQAVSQLLAEQYEAAAQSLAKNALTNVEGLLGCPQSDSCVQDFIASFGKRAYRRPLSDAEVTRHFGFYSDMKQKYGDSDALRMLVEAFLQSPHFLYRVETQGTPAETPGAIRLDAYEVATRLSYLLWSTMPDDELFAAANKGELETKEQIAAQARRMVEHPNARDSVKSFYRQWLDLEHVEALEKSAEAFPSFDPQLLPMMRQETELFLEHVTFDGGGFSDLLTADYSFMNQALAEHYGVANPPSGSQFVQVQLDGSRYSGLLSHASLLSSFAHADQTSLVERGKFVREQWLCQDVKPPPDNAVITVPDPDPNSTTRERFEAHVSEPVCAGCHLDMDPIGFAFENFDAVGQWRDTENGKPIDSKGELTRTDVDGPIDSVVALSSNLAQSSMVRTCFVSTWYRYSAGRATDDADACNVQRIEKQFANEGDLKELLVELTQTDAFLYRRAEEQQ